MYLPYRKGGLIKGTRSRLLGAALASFLLLVLPVACSNGSTSTGTGNKTLVIGNAFSITQGLDPARAQGTTVRYIFAAMYQSLLSTDPKELTKLNPSVAQSYTTNSDGSVTFHLRHDVRFSDGTPLTSADVVFSLMRAVNINGTISILVAGLTATAVDTSTVLVKDSTPNFPIAANLADPQLPILNSKLVIANGGSDASDAAKADTADTFLNQHSAGSGPYTLQSFDPQSQIVLKANPLYAGPKPAYSKVVFLNEAPDAQALDVQKGPNTIALDLSPHQASILDRSKVNVLTVPALAVFILELNVNSAISPASANVNFRQAVRYALDYKTLLTVAGLGATRQASLMGSGIQGTLPPSGAISQDVSKAKAFLAQSGETNPTITMDYSSAEFPEGIDYSAVAQVIQANLKAIGITLNLSPVSSSQYDAKWHGGKSQMVLGEVGGSFVDPSFALLFAPGGPIAGWMGWKPGADPAVDALVAQIPQASTPAQQIQLYMQLFGLMNDFAVQIPMFSGALVLVGSKSVGGLNLTQLGAFDITQLT